MFIWSINQPWQQKQSSTRLILTDVYQTYYKDIVDLYWTFHVVFFLETDINIYFLNLAVQKWKTKKCIHTIKIRYILFYIKFDVWKRLLKMIIYIFIFIRMKKPVLWIKTRYVLFWQNWIFTKAKEIQWLERKLFFFSLSKLFSRPSFSQWVLSNDWVVKNYTLWVRISYLWNT